MTKKTYTEKSKKILEKGLSLGGRPKKEIDYKTLESLCQIQCTGEECASVLGMDYDTLNNALKKEGFEGFSDYSKQKAPGGKASLRRRQYKAAMDGNATMLVWLGKNWLGQTDKHEVKQETEHKGGIMRVPAIGSVDEWSDSAVGQQEKLKGSIDE